jgi:REP element-mobilizing transposase RayT
VNHLSYRDRGYLPHFELENSTYFVTFRLFGTLPKNVVDEFEHERRIISEMAKKENRELTAQERTRLKYLESTKVQQYLDKGIGECWLKEPSVARMIKASIHHFDGSRYVSHALCIMPNHVHWLLTPLQNGPPSRVDSPLSSIMHSMKSYTSHEANKILKRKGNFWSREYYDHLIRSSEQFGRLLVYVLENPVKAGLCKRWHEWPWTTCSEKIRTSLIL